MEDYCKSWKSNPPPYNVKKALIEEVARMVSKMHHGGINHRDCYICHFLLHLPFDGTLEPKISIIDLHRAQIRSRVPERWINKDLIALFYSTMDIGLTNRDYLRFFRIYCKDSTLREFLFHNKRLFSSITDKADKIRKRTLRNRL